MALCHCPQVKNQSDGTINKARRLHPANSQTA
jgi:hypothetical protein